MNTAFLMGLLIIIGGIFSLELGLSVAIVEILLGVAGANIFGMSEEQWIPFVANFGLLGIMFFAGFETDVKSLRKNWQKSLFMGAASFFVPFSFVYFASCFLFHFSHSASLIIAATLSPASIAIIYTLLKEKGFLSKQSGQIILSSAMVIDIISMILLSVLFEGISFASFIFLLVVISSLFFLPRFGKWLFSRYSGDAAEFKIKFILITLIALLSVSEKINVHGAVLAFIAGFFFSEMIGEHEVLEEKLRAIIFGFMAPVFFFSAGLSVDLSLITLSNIVFIASLGGLVLFIKYFSAYLAARRYLSGKLSVMSAWLFSINVTLGIVFARFALHKNIIAPSFYASLLLILVLTSVVASLAIRIAPHEL